MRQINELLAIVFAALALGGLVIVAAEWANTPPVGEAPCYVHEDEFGWGALRCGNHQGQDFWWEGIR